MRTLGERVYSLLLFAYPADFRREYGAEMARAFATQYRRARGVRRARVWFDTLIDLFPTATQEHINVTLHDLSLAMRRLEAYPAAATLAMLSLALGIGANTTIFTFVHTTLLKDLPYRDPDRLLQLWSVGQRDRQSFHGFSSADFMDIRAQSTSFEAMALSAGRNPVTLNSGGVAERVFVEFVTPGMFEMLGVAPAAGRLFDADEVHADAKVLLISYEFWIRRFNADPAVFEKPLVVDGTQRTVVGVMPAGFRLHSDPGTVDIWSPINLASDNWIGRKVRWLMASGRLKPGVSAGHAQKEIDAIAGRITAAHPDTNKDWAVVVEPWDSLWRRGLGNVLYPLFGAVLFVLLIACTNVSNLLVARAAARRREISLRAALGATRGRLLRELVADGMVMAIPAAALGVLFAHIGIRLVLALVPTFPQAKSIGLNLPVLSFTLASGLCAGIAAALAPAWLASRVDLNEALKEGGRGSAGGARSRLRNSLVVVQVALAMTLLVGAGLMISTLRSLNGLDLGFEPDNLITLDIQLSGPRYSNFAPKREIDMRRVEPAVEAFYRQTLEKVKAVPGIEGAALSSGVPVIRISNQRRYTIAGRPAPPPGEREFVVINMVMGDFPRTYRIRMKSGRFLDDTDKESTPWTCVINETFARKQFANQDPIGQFITVNAVEEERPRRVVGVITDTRQTGFYGVPQPEIYTSYRQQVHEYPGDGQRSRFRPTLAIRSALPPGVVADSVRKQVMALDPDQPVDTMQTVRERLDERTLVQRFVLTLLSVFAGLALLLAAMGIYAVMSHSVADRSHEIGIRITLGATRGDTLRLVMRHGLVLCVAGVALGTTASFGVTRVLRQFLFGVEPTDPATYATVTAVLALIALLACYVPAMRATRVNPVVALRRE